MLEKGPDIIQSQSEVPSVPDAAVLQRMQAAYDAGKILQAFQIGAAVAPWKDWAGLDACILAGRMFAHLGAPRLGRLYHLRALRWHGNPPMAAPFIARALLERWGPLRCLHYCRQMGDLGEVDHKIRADWFGFRAYIAGIYRDFSSADELIAQALRLAPEDPWIHIEQARVFEAQDRYDEALAAARRSTEIEPMYRSGVHAVAHLLQVMDRDGKALDLLRQGADRFESVPILQQLAQIETQLERFADAEATLQRIEPLCPVFEKSTRQYVTYMRFHAAHCSGRVEQALALAEQLDDKQGKKIAEILRTKLAEGVAPRRVILDFPFVRQHHMTCAPATMSALSRFFGREANHLSMVDAICYDGTPAYNQRNWADSNGWLARDFTFDWKTAVALIDRGIPFTLATVYATSGHLQAVIGYDALRGTVICRDPYQYSITEFTAEGLSEYNAAHGPRSMLMIPPEKAPLLEGIDLPDAAFYDLLHAVEAGLARYDRASAAQAYAQLEAAAPAKHRLVLHAAGALARYDRDYPRLLQVLDDQLEKFPDDQPLLLQKIYVLRQMERRDLLAPLLEKATANPGNDAIFLQLAAEEMRADHGIDDQVMRLLRKVLRRKPVDTASLIAMADALWDRRQLEEATDLYFLAACTNDKEERGARTYFIASRHLRQTDRALAMLQRRVDRLAARSSEPACTLFWALDVLDRAPEALAVLDRALTQRPDDGPLLLHAADAYGRHANLPRAHDLLEKARSKSHETHWLRTDAALALYEGNSARALESWKRVLEAEPLSEEANHRVAQLIAETESRQAALAHIEAAKARFPHNTMLHFLHIAWLDDAGPAAVEPVARQMVERWPGSVRARYELSIRLTALQRGEEALQHAQAALALSPSSTNCHYAAARALRELGRLDEALEEYRAALRISVDHTSSMRDLFQYSPTPDAQRQALDFIHWEMVRQVIFGDGLPTFRNLAANVLDAAQVLAVLQEAQAARPDLWQGWSSLVYQFIDMNQLDEALQTALKATERFPLLPRTWLDLSEVHRIKGDRPGQIAALRHCCQLGQNWSLASRALGRALYLAGDVDGAHTALRSAIAREPLEAENHHTLAQFLWQENKREEAIQCARRAVMLNPLLDSAWNSLQGWSEETSQQAQVVAIARDVCGKRAGEAAPWLVLARVLRGPEATEERLRACDTAIRLAPRDAEAYDLKACILQEAGRPQEAMQACDPAQFNGQPPLELRGRRAWLLAQQGEMESAIAQMWQLARENPMYFWAWNNAARWLSNTPQKPEYLEVATSMARLFPHNALALNNLAYAQKSHKDGAAARATMQRVLEVSPDNSWAQETLFADSLADNDLPNAQWVLQLIQQHQPIDVFQSCSVQVAAAQRDQEQACRALSALCRSLRKNDAPLHEAIRAMDKAGWKKRVDQTLEQAATDDREINPLVVQAWAQRAAENSTARATAKIPQLFAPGSEQWVAAAMAHMTALARIQPKSFSIQSGPGRARRRVWAFVKKHHDLMRGNTRLWGNVGYQLMSLDRLRDAVDWLSDYARRPDAQPWMLLNLVTALRRLGRPEEAHAVGEAALKLPSDHCTGKHRIWLAFDEAVIGKPGPHSASLTAQAAAEQDRHYPTLLKMISLLGTLLETPGAHRPTLARAARAGLVRIAREAASQQWKNLKHPCHAAARRVALYRGGWLYRAWATVYCRRRM